MCKPARPTKPKPLAKWAKSQPSQGPLTRPANPKQLAKWAKSQPSQGPSQAGLVHPSGHPSPSSWPSGRRASQASQQSIPIHFGDDFMVTSFNGDYLLLYYFTIWSLGGGRPTKLHNFILKNYYYFNFLFFWSAGLRRASGRPFRDLPLLGGMVVSAPEKVRSNSLETISRSPIPSIGDHFFPGVALQHEHFSNASSHKHKFVITSIEKIVTLPILFVPCKETTTAFMYF